MIVYKVTNLINGKTYVGQTTKTLVRRFGQHASYKGDSCLLTKAIRKYRRDSFHIETLIECQNLEELNEAERLAIEAHKSLSPNGYNLQAGGNSSPMHEETRRKLAIRRQGRKPNLGHQHSEETRAKMREAHLGSTWRPLNRDEKNAHRNGQDCRTVYGFNEETGEGIFLRSLRLGRALGFDPGHIGAVCSGKARSHKGFVWRDVNGP